MTDAEALKRDREVVLVAVQRHGPDLYYADMHLRADPEIALAAVMQVIQAMPKLSTYDQDRYRSMTDSALMKSVGVVGDAAIEYVAAALAKAKASNKSKSTNKRARLL